MLEEAKPEGVVIATPNRIVCQLLDCIERGIGTLIEKPVRLGKAPCNLESAVKSQRRF
jgi:hypothetical protein